MGHLRKAEVTIAALLATGIGTLALAGWRRRKRSPRRVFVLEYHDVSDGPECEGTIAAWRFRRHLRWLGRRFRFETLAQAAELLAEPGALDADRVVVTFDDGLRGNYRWAWPVLREQAVPATIFLTTGFLDGGELWFDLARRGLEAAVAAGDGLAPELRRTLQRDLGRWPPEKGVEREVERLKRARPEVRSRLLDALRGSELPLRPAAEALTWDQVRELDAAGIEIGCHTVSHPILAALPPAQQEAEIVGSRDRIAEEIGRLPTTFAVPNGSRGDYDETTLEILRAHGFAAACTTVRGSNAPGCDPLELRRIGIGSDSNLTLRARIGGLFDQEVRDLAAGARRLVPW